VTYNIVVTMVASTSLTTRCAAAASGEGVQVPLVWAQENAWELASSPGWSEAWKSALDGMTVNVNPDTGIRDDVITDGMILSAVQTLLAAEAPPG
jgi:hypothetical protein